MSKDKSKAKTKRMSKPDQQQIKYIPIDQNSQYVKTVLILPKEIVIEIAKTISNYPLS
jgi:hypothetical protein